MEHAHPKTGQSIVVQHLISCTHCITSHKSYNHHYNTLILFFIWFFINNYAPQFIFIIIHHFHHYDIIKYLSLLSSLLWVSIFTANPKVKLPNSLLTWPARPNSLSEVRHFLVTLSSMWCVRYPDDAYTNTWIVIWEWYLLLSFHH